jgi:serine/threonine-protein kinase RsbW
MGYGSQSARAAAYGTIPYRPTLNLNIYSELKQASEAVARVGKWLEQERVESECIGDVMLVLAEALNNVIEHAYGTETSGDIQIKGTLRAQTLSLQIVDKGRPFDGPPDEVILNTEVYELSEMPDGGFGWFLIKSLTEDIHFSRDGDKNKLTLVVGVRPATA